MAVPDINHKVCMLCDHYDEKDCPYCGMGFEGFEIKKHEQQIRAEAEQEHAKMCESCIHKVSKEDIDAIRVDVIDECIKDLEQCYPLVDNGDILYGFSCAIQRLKQLKKLDKLSSTAQE